MRARPRAKGGHFLRYFRRCDVRRSARSGEVRKKRGEYIGGCTETFDAFNEGRLQKRLEANGVAFDRGKKADAYSFLPKWLHPR